MTKVCRVCEQERPLADFDRDLRTKSRLRSRCRVCVSHGGVKPDRRKAKYRRDYEKNAEEYRRRARDRYQELRAIIHDARNHPCVDCGTQLPPGCMDLDHVRGEKLFDLGQFHKARVIPGMTREAMIRAEIDKCEVRCPNCHRLRHHNLQTVRSEFHKR